MSMRMVYTHDNPSKLLLLKAELTTLIKLEVKTGRYCCEANQLFYETAEFLSVCKNEDEVRKLMIGGLTLIFIVNDNHHNTALSKYSNWILEKTGVFLDEENITRFPSFGEDCITVADIVLTYPYEPDDFQQTIHLKDHPFIVSLNTKKKQSISEKPASELISQLQVDIKNEKATNTHDAKVNYCFQLMSDALAICENKDELEKILIGGISLALSCHAILAICEENADVFFIRRHWASMFNNRNYANYCAASSRAYGNAQRLINSDTEGMLPILDVKAILIYFADYLLYGSYMTGRMSFDDISKTKFLKDNPFIQSMPVWTSSVPIKRKLSTLST